MATTSKSSKKDATKNNTTHRKVTATPNSEFTDVFTPLAFNTVERVADLQKAALDIAAEQTAAWAGAWKQAFSYLPLPAPMFVVDAAVRAVETVVATQKSAIDMVLEQTKSATEIAMVRAAAYTTIAGGVGNGVKKTMYRSVEAQKQVLDYATGQNKAFFETTKKHLGAVAGPATAVVDTLERGTDAVIEAQKSFLNMASTASKN